jgi:hypothetical protein
MMQWFRRRTRGVTTALLVSLAVLGGWSVVAHGADCHDAECGLVPAHDASAHAFRAPGTPADEHDIHCTLCHAARTFRPPLSTPQFCGETASRDVRMPVADGRPRVVSTAAQPPLRSPPLAAAVSVLA